MAKTHDYLDYLDAQIGISPAHSQEEYQAAETIASLMAQHDLEPQIEEFDTPTSADLVRGVLAVLAFVGLFLTMTGSTLFVLVGLVLALVPAVIWVLGLIGRAPDLGALGPKARSQNVIAFHPASGPNVTKGSRRIVVVAHYDSPREDFLRTSPLAPYLPLVAKMASWSGIVVGVCALVQVMGFLPAGVRIVVAIVGIVCAVPSLLLMVQAVCLRFSPCTEGANDNKSGVAAMLGVLERVRPAASVPVEVAWPSAAGARTGVETGDEGLAPEAAPAATPAAATPAAPDEDDFSAAPVDADEADFAAPVPAPVADFGLVGEGAGAPEAGAGSSLTDEGGVEPAPAAAASSPAEPAAPATPVVRHGEEALRYFGVLPESCEIVYEEAATASAASSTGSTPRRTMPAAGLDDVAAQGAADEGAEAWGDDFYGEGDEGDEGDEGQKGGLSGVLATIGGLLGRLVDAVRGLVARIGAAGNASDDAEGDQDAEAGAADAANGQGAGTLDDTYDGFEADVDTDATNPVGRPAPASRPSEPDDPSWGTTDFRPEVSDVARRASLFDLPSLDNSGEIDPFATDPNAARIGPEPQPASTPLVSAGAARRSATQPAAQASAQAQAQPQTAPGQEAITTIGSDYEPVDGSGTQKGGLFGLFGGKKKKDKAARKAADRRAAADDDGWYDDEDDDGSWRGGATTRSDLRLVDGEDGAGDQAGASDEGVAAAAATGAPGADELVDAVLGMNDDDLIAHDIWFVALGASSSDQAGMRDFLASHRREVRGSFVINLDSVGAGQLTVFTSEGLEQGRRADRRLVRMVGQVAEALHVPLNKAPLDWTSTDATVSMRSSLRSVTITGLGESGLRELAGTSEDVLQNVDAAQVEQVSQLVCELIRRS